jgi:hypothetical protein
MNRACKKRLRKLSQQIDAMPIAPEVEKAAFERFRETGELPEHQRLARAVTDRALRGGVDQGYSVVVDFKSTVERLLRIANNEEESETEPQPLRKWLFDEAVYGADFVRCAARGALKILVAAGRDVTDPDFLGADTVLPDYGTVGLHVLGFPERLAKPPYEDQARRLFERFAVLRERTNRDDAWYEEFSKVSFQFLHKGELPEEELMCEAVLAYTEFMWLLGHFLGHGDAEVMAAFDQVARAQGEVRAAAIVRVRVLAAEGRLVPSRGAIE